MIGNAHRDEHRKISCPLLKAIQLMIFHNINNREKLETGPIFVHFNPI